MKATPSDQYLWFGLNQICPAATFRRLDEMALGRVDIRSAALTTLPSVFSVCDLYRAQNALEMDHISREPIPRRGLPQPLARNAGPGLYLPQVSPTLHGDDLQFQAIGHHH